MDWTVQPHAEANHNPLVTVNGDSGTAPIVLGARVGEAVVLDASLSRDPDGHKLRYKWLHYPEAGFVPGQGLAALTIANGDTARATVTATDTCRPEWMPRRAACADGVAHIILAVAGGGSPTLTSYRRVILNVRRPAPPSAR